MLNKFCFMLYGIIGKKKILIRGAVALVKTSEESRKNVFEAEESLASGSAS